MLYTFCVNVHCLFQFSNGITMQEIESLAQNEVIEPFRNQL